MSDSSNSSSSSSSNSSNTIMSRVVGAIPAVCCAGSVAHVAWLYAAGKLPHHDVPLHFSFAGHADMFVPAPVAAAVYPLLCSVIALPALAGAQLISPQPQFLAWGAAVVLKLQTYAFAIGRHEIHKVPNMFMAVLWTELTALGIWAYLKTKKQNEKN